MPGKVCSVCKNKFDSGNKFFGRNSSLHNNCDGNEKSQQKNEVRPVRTSTPIAELENSPSESFSDSVSDFFYQSWKSGLHSDDLRQDRRSSNQWNPQPATVVQPVCYPPPIIYVNTVIYQPYMPVQQVGYRSDGTFGILPVYWPYSQ